MAFDALCHHVAVLHSMEPFVLAQCLPSLSSLSVAAGAGGGSCFSVAHASVLLILLPGHEKLKVISGPPTPTL